MSISSSKLIQLRTLEFCQTIDNWRNDSVLFNKINLFVDKEFNMILENDRIGKGIKFISNHVAKGIFKDLINKKKTSIDFIIKFIQSTFKYGEENESIMLQLYALQLIA